jgi:hypothetical protein
MFFKTTGNLQQKFSVSNYFSQKTKIRRHSPVYWLLLVMALYKNTVLSTGYFCNGTIQKYRQEKSNWDTLLVTVAGSTTLKNLLGVLNFGVTKHGPADPWFNAELWGNFRVGWSSDTNVWGTVVLDFCMWVSCCTWLLYVGIMLYLTFVCGYHVVLDFCMWVSAL